MPTFTSFIRIQSTKLALCALLAAAPPPAGGQLPELPSPHGRQQEDEKRLPNGKLQSEEILKANYEENLKDLEKLRTTAETIEQELRKNKGHVLSLKSMRDLDEIDRLTRRIRGRMKRF